MSSSKSNRNTSSPRLDLAGGRIDPEVGDARKFAAVD